MYYLYQLHANRVTLLFMLTDGNLDVYQSNKLLTSITVWTTFGELAILYNCTRTASVKGEVNKKIYFEMILTVLIL